MAAILGCCWIFAQGTAPRASTSKHARQDELARARRLITAQKYVDAVGILRSLVASNPKDAESQLLLGTTLALIPRRTEAIEALRRGVELRPSSAQAQLMLANALARFGESEEARVVYEKALTLDPTLVMAHANLATILAGGGSLDPAIDHFTKAISLQGDSQETARYYLLRGRALRQKELHEQSAQDFESAVRLRPNYAAAYLELGRARSDLQDEARALEAFRKAVELAPEDAETRYRLGSQYLRNGKAALAADQLRVAARLRPGDRNVLYALVRALRSSGNSQEAEPLARKMAEAAQAQALHEPDVLRAGELNNAGISLEKAGDYAGALQKYRAALEISPEEIGFRRNLALVLCRLERWKEAHSELKEVLRMAPGDADATKALYVVLEKIDDKR
jgi:tetratricopeptide (TPR) repeat protein